LLEERCNTALINLWKYQESLKKYYNKSVVQTELNIGDLILKKNICTRDKHKFLSPWEGPFIIVDVAAPRAYVLAEVDGAMLPNTWNADQLRKCFSAYINWSTISSSGLSTEGALQSYNKNNKSPARDDAFHVWSDASLELNIERSSIGGQRVDTARCILMICNTVPD
jgi:hypothetical protein